MSKVYFKRYEGNDPEVLSGLAKELLEVLIDRENVELEKKVPIKVHFGEKGNKTFVSPKAYDGLIDLLEDKSVESSFIETNVLYRGSRTTREDHLRLAKDHGFTRIPVIIADGEIGEAVHEVEINKEFFKSVKLGKAFNDYNQILVTSHFKGHMLAGFGGALKQLAMGFASRSGKMAQHSSMVPTVSGHACTSCGICVDSCDVDAIEINNHAEISNTKCVGCAACIAVCPEGAIRNDWNSSNFIEKIAEYSYGAQLSKKHVYITYLINITKDCDCMGIHMQPLTKDIGVFASTDPVAIDRACLDILQKESGKDLFESGRKVFDHAKKIGFSAGEYEVIEL